ncbi:MAG: type II 3-dehydroquinate dehydratase [Pseudomonadales bacterium]
MPNKSVLILNGPGLADLKSEDGSNDLSLDMIRGECDTLCANLDIDLDFRQTDDEQQMLKFISDDSQSFSALVINPSCLRYGTPQKLNAFDSAIKQVAHLRKPVIEVRLSNIFADPAETMPPMQGIDGGLGFVNGMGAAGYLLAIRAADRKLRAA